MSLQHLSPAWVIPEGTQVVLQRELPVIKDDRSGGERDAFKKAGTLARVVEAPLTNEHRYLVEFADGTRARPKRHDLVMHRSDHPEASLQERPHLAYEDSVVLSTIMGSRAYGLADESSDIDERGVFVPPADWHWSLQPVPDQIEFTRERGDGLRPADICWWEIEKFLRLALKGNPNILELLWVDERWIVSINPVGQRLRDIREAFLSTYLHRTYSGYVLSQFRRMQKAVDAGKTFRPKHAMHLIRLLHSGIAAVNGGGLMVDVGCHRDELLPIKRGEVPFEAVYHRALELERAFDAALEQSPLPDRPDVDRVDRFLVDVRRDRARERS